MASIAIISAHIHGIWVAVIQEVLWCFRGLLKQTSSIGNHRLMMRINMGPEKIMVGLEKDQWTWGMLAKFDCG